MLDGCVFLLNRVIRRTEGTNPSNNDGTALVSNAGGGAAVAALGLQSLNITECVFQQNSVVSFLLPPFSPSLSPFAALLFVIQQLAAHGSIHLANSNIHTAHGTQHTATFT